MVWVSAQVTEAVGKNRFESRPTTHTRADRRCAGVKRSSWRHRTEWTQIPGRGWGGVSADAFRGDSADAPDEDGSGWTDEDFATFNELLIARPIDGLFPRRDAGL